MKTTERVALISYHTCPLAILGGRESGGMNVYIRELARRLGERGLVVDVFTRYGSPMESCVVPLGERARVVHIKAGEPAPLDRNKLWRHVPEFVEGVTRFSRNQGIRYDLIHSHYWLSGWAARRLKEVWSAPVIQMFHTLGGLKNLVARSEAEMEPIRRIRVEGLLMRYADCIVTANPMEKAQMTWFYGTDPSKVRVIPCGVNLELFKPLPRKDSRERLGLTDERVILYVGRIEPIKGLDRLIGAMKLLRGRGFEDVLLYIVGGSQDARDKYTTEEMRRLRGMAGGEGLEGRVQFLGPVPQEELPQYYSAADICVLPSRYESFGIVALEAMACGTPMVASKVGGLRFIVEDGVTGLHAADGEPSNLAEKMAALLKDDDLRVRLGRESLNRVKRYDWGKVAERIISLYRNVMDEPSCGNESGGDEGSSRGGNRAAETRSFRS